MNWFASCGIPYLIDKSVQLFLLWYYFSPHPKPHADVQSCLRVLQGSGDWFVTQRHWKELKVQAAYHFEMSHCLSKVNYQPQKQKDEVSEAPRLPAVTPRCLADGKWKRNQERRDAFILKYNESQEQMWEMVEVKRKIYCPGTALASVNLGLLSWGWFPAGGFWRRQIRRGQCCWAPLLSRPN